MADRSLVVRIVGDSSSLERSFARSSAATRSFDRDFSRATRGVIAGSGVFRSFSRTLAFASGGFLAFGGISSFLRKSVDAAKEAQVANAQLATQLANSGKSFAAYRGEINNTISRLSALAGIEDDELKGGLTTLLRTVPNVGKALRDLGLAADIARARHISLAQAATIIAKTEAGNTTLLRRQAFQIAKNATAEQALAKVRAVVAGQARAGTTEQERFGAVLHQTEEIIGTGILPVLNKYLVSGTRWLEQMNESGKLQREVASGAHAFSVAVGEAASTVKTIDRITGGFRNTLELLLALKLARVVTGWSGSLGIFSGKARTAEERAALLQAQLSRLAAVGVITVGIEVLLNRKAIDNTVSGFLDKHGLGFLGSGKKDASGLNLGNIDEAIAAASKFGNSLTSEALEKYKRFLVEQDAKTVKRFADITGGAAQHAALLGNAITNAADTTTRKSGLNLTAGQRNTFFDNAIARILLRGGLGNISQQIAALQKANSLIAARLKETKDVTRRLNLEDELLKNTAQIKDLQGQAAADAVQKQQEALQKRQDAMQEFIAGLQLGVTKAQATSGFNDDIAALKALQAGIKKEISEFGTTADLQGQLFDVQQQIVQARKDQAAKAVAALTAKQFRQLGLSATGDEITPGVAGLKKRLGQLSANVTASSLNTPKLQSELARFRKVLSEGLVPKDVRAKIKEMMDQISDELKGHVPVIDKFARTNQSALLKGLGLDPAQLRAVKARLSQVGVDGRVPQGSPSALGSGATTVVHTTVKLDNDVLGRAVTRHQQTRRARNPTQVRGLFPGGV